MKEQPINFDQMASLMTARSFEELTPSEEKMVLQVFDSAEQYNASRLDFGKIAQAVAEDAPDLVPDPGILLRLQNTLEVKTQNPQKNPVQGLSIFPWFGTFVAGKMTGMKMGAVALFCWGMLTLESGPYGHFQSYYSDTTSLEMSANQNRIWHDSCRTDSSSLLP